MSPGQYFRAAAKRAVEWAWESSHRVYVVLTLVAGAIIIVIGIHFDKTLLIVAPAVTLPILAFIGIWREAYRIYRMAEEQREREGQEAARAREAAGEEHAATVGELHRRIVELETQLAGPPLSADAIRMLLRAAQPGGYPVIYFFEGVGAA
jgi:hypothetical protein